MNATRARAKNSIDNNRRGGHRRSGFVRLRLLMHALCLFLLFAFIIVAPPARAEEPLRISALITPGDLTAPGEVTFTVTLTNVSGARATNIRIAPDETKTGASVDPIDAGKTYVFETGISVSQKQLDAGRVDLIVSYRADGTNYKKKLAANVTRVDAQAQVSFSRHMPDCARAGDTAEIVYIVQNTGTIAVSEMYITDPIGNYISAQTSLSPGESKRFSHFVRVKETLTSSPTLRFVSTETGMSYREALNERALPVTEDKLTLAWQVDDHNSTLTLTITNTGLFTYTDFHLHAGALGGALNLPNVLGPGEAYSYTWKNARAGEYTGTLMARDGAGNEVAFQSPTITFAEATSENVPSTVVTPTLRTLAQYTRIAMPGRVRFDIEIDGGSENIRGARLVEQTLGTVRTFAILQADERTSLNVFVDVEDDQTYAFSLLYEDAQGKAQTVQAEPVQIVIAANGVIPETLGAENELHAVKGVGNLPTIIIAACVALMALIALLAAINRRERKRKLRKKSDKFADTGKYKPVRVTNERAAKETK